MAGDIILPPNYRETSGPLIFLAGPITGAPKWHNQAIKLILGMDKEMNIACPSFNVDHEYIVKNPGEFKESLYQEDWEQVDWEGFYLSKAAESGAVLFWFPLEETHYCNRPYAQTSRVEIGEWKTRHIQNNCGIVAGFEPGFSGEKYLKYKLKKECPDIPLCTSLEETCRSAVEKAKTGLTKKS